jgi:hypothetical protein
MRFIQERRRSTHNDKCLITFTALTPSAPSRLSSCRLVNVPGKSTNPARRIHVKKLARMLYSACQCHNHQSPQILKQERIATHRNTIDSEQHVHVSRVHLARRRRERRAGGRNRGSGGGGGRGAARFGHGGGFGRRRDGGARRRRRRTHGGGRLRILAVVWHRGFRRRGCCWCDAIRCGGRDAGAGVCCGLCRGRRRAGKRGRGRSGAVRLRGRPGALCRGAGALCRGSGTVGRRRRKPLPLAGFLDRRGRVGPRCG